MKKSLSVSKLLLFSFVCSALLQGCLKDSATRTYTMYIPVYRSIADVRAAIKSDVAKPIQNPGKIFVLGNYIFLNEIEKGVHIIDNTNPEAPVNKYFINIPGNLDLAVKGNILYADLYRDLLTIDISNPAAIQIKKISEKVFPARTYSNGFIADSTQVIVDWKKKDTTVAAESVIQNPIGIWFTSAQDLGTLTSTKSGTGGSTARFTLLNNYLYTVSNTSLHVFNVSQPENPVYTNQLEVGWQIETIYPFKNNLFMGSQNGIFIYNTDDPANPVPEGQFSHFTACDPVIADDNTAYVTLSTGTICHGSFDELDVLDIQDVSNPIQLTAYSLTNPHGLSKTGNNLFICDGAGGLKVFDVSNPSKPVLLHKVTGLDAIDIITLNKNAIVVAKDGLYQYDYTNPLALKLRSKLSISRF